MNRHFTPSRWSAWILLAVVLATAPANGQVRDGGVDPKNLGKGEWILEVGMATNRLYWMVESVTNETSLMLFCKTQGIRFLVVRAATADTLFDGEYGNYPNPQFNSNFVAVAHTNGIQVFGWHRAYGSNVVGEIAMADYIFNQGADGLVWDVQDEWESATIGNPDFDGAASAWALCSAVRAKWTNKFLAYAPPPIISLHEKFPYKEFGYWCDAALPQIYPEEWTGTQGRPSGGINWTDANWQKWHKDLASLAATNIGGLTVRWTNSVKPLAPVTHVFGPYAIYWDEVELSPELVTEFMDYLSVDAHAPSSGGYRGASFIRAELHGLEQWTNIGVGTIGVFPGVVNSLILDDQKAQMSGSWTAVRTFYNSWNLQSALFAGNGSGTDTNSFGTNYFTKSQGSGTNYVQFTPNIVVPGHYVVHEWHPFRAEASARVPIVVTHGGGSTTVYANQTTNAGNWSRLGQFYFGPGTNGSVRITDGVAEAGRIAIADAVKLVFVPPVSPPSAPIRLQALAVSSSQINLSWTGTATNAGMYVISRAVSEAGPFVDVVSVPASAAGLQDKDLEDDKTYYYLVRATNLVGQSSSVGPVFATTYADTPVWAFGDNTHSQLRVPGVTDNVVAVAGGQWHNLALTREGQVVAWGRVGEGQSSVPPGLADAVAIAAGGYHSLALKSDGTVAAWGANSDGQTDVPAACRQVVGVAAGTWHSLALRADGRVVGWGHNDWGQATPPGGLVNAIAVAAGGNHSLALRADGTVAAWGENTDAYGQFAGQSTVPVGLTNVVGIAAGQYHSLALKANGTVIGFGDNSQGQCTPPADLAGVVGIAAGGAHSVALRTNGAVVAWGANWNGQTVIPTNCTNVIAVAAGMAHTLAVGSGAQPMPRLLLPVKVGARFRVAVQTLPRRQYVLEYNASLDSKGWSSLPAVRGNGALLLLTDPNAVDSPRFYRMRTPK